MISLGQFVHNFHKHLSGGRVWKFRKGALPRPRQLADPRVYGQSPEEGDLGDAGQGFPATTGEYIGAFSTVRADESTM